MTHLDDQFGTARHSGAVFDELETNEMSVLDFRQFHETTAAVGRIAAGVAYFFQQFLPLFVASELNRCLDHATGVVLQGNFPGFPPDQCHDLTHEILGLFFRVRLDTDFIPQQLCVDNDIGMAALRLALLPRLSLSCAAGKFIALSLRSRGTRHVGTEKNWLAPTSWLGQPRQSVLR